MQIYRIYLHSSHVFCRFVDIVNALLNEDEEELSKLIRQATQDELNVVMFRSIMLTDNINLLHMVLEAGPNIDYQDTEGRTALFLAVKYNQIPMVKLLIQNRCNVNLGKFNHSSALHLAAKKGSAEVISLLVDAGHELDIMNWGGNTALLIACRFGHTLAVKTLISKGADVNLCNKLGHYPLHYAAFSGDGNLVMMLINKGANPDVRTHLGINPIMLACERKHCGVVEVLASKCDLEHREQLYGGTVLHWAVASGCSLCVEYLFSEGASMTIPDHSGRTPVMEAVQSNHPQILRYLLDQHVTNHESFLQGGANAGLLHLAADLGRTECIKVICEHSLTRHLMNHHDFLGNTCLDFAAMQCEKEALRLLLRLGAYASSLVPDIPAIVTRLSERNDSDSLDFSANLLGENECGKTLHNPVQPRTESTSGRVELEVDAVTGSGCQYHHRQDSSRRVVLQDPIQRNSNLPGLRRTNPHSDKNDHFANLCFQFSIGNDCEKTLASNLDRAQDIHCEQTIELTAVDKIANLFVSAAIEAKASRVAPVRKIFKTYSAVKMSMIDMLRSASGQQMVAPVKFDFNTWLDNGPEAFVLKVTSLDLTDWLHDRMHTPWSLRELCRGCIRRTLGYRASDKVEFLPVPATLKHFLNMKELDDLQSSDINIKGTGAFDDIDVE